MRRLIVIFVVVVFSASCEKGTGSASDCERNHYGWVNVTCTSSNPYKIYVNNEYRGTISGKSTMEVKVPSGSQSFYALQVSGYILYPTEVRKTFSVSDCRELTWSIP